MAGGRALVFLLMGCYASLVRGKEELSAKGCFAASCGCVCVKKVATTGIFYINVMGGGSCSPCCQSVP